MPIAYLIDTDLIIFVFGSQDTEILQQIADLAASGKLRIAIGRSIGLDQAVALISDLGAGRRAKGKAVIVIG